jgi:hypothetical protein
VFVLVDPCSAHPAATTSPATPPPTRPSRRPAARRGHEHFVVNPEAASRRPPSDAVACHLSCGFVMPRAIRCRRRSLAPLRQCSASTHPGRSAISSTWQRPTARHAGCRLPAQPPPTLPGLRPACRVVALREVGEMARPLSEICRPARVLSRMSQQLGNQVDMPRRCPDLRPGIQVAHKINTCSCRVGRPNTSCPNRLTGAISRRYGRTTFRKHRGCEHLMT